MKKIFTLLFAIMFVCSASQAQITYYSKAAATDFSDPASWGTNADGTGTSPAAITNADNYIVANASALTLSSSASVRQLTINTGSLTVNSNTLTVSIAAQANSSLTVNGGTLTVSGGNVNVNGNMLIATGGNFTQSGGTISVDGNNAGAAATSVATGTSIFSIGTTATAYTTGTVSLTGGTLIIVDPHTAAASTDYAFNANLPTNGRNITATGTHTLQFGNGVSTDAGGNATNGFWVYYWYGTGAFKPNNFTVDALTGTNRFVFQQYKSITGGNVNVISGDLRYVSTGPYNVAGNFTVAAAGTFTNTVTVVLGDGSYTSSTAITNAASTIPQTVGGAGTYRNLTAAPTANFTNLQVNNTNATGVTIAAPLSVSGTLTLTAGLVNTTTANKLSIGTATAAGTLSGGSSTAYINGPFARTFAASRTASGTYSAATLFPVGKGGNYLPLYVDPTTTAGGPIVVSGEAFTSNSGTPGSGVGPLSANRWEGLITSGAGNFTNAFIRESDVSISSASKILMAASAAGTYNSIVPASTYAAGSPNTLTTATAILAAAYTGYLGHDLALPCTAPADQPTAFVASQLGATGFNGAFTAAASAPSNYLVVRYPGGSAVTNPADNTTYIVGGTLGTGTIVSVSSATTFSQSGLTANTTYDYYVYSYNAGSCSPAYNVTTPLKGIVTTCASSVGAPGAPTGSAITSSSFTVSWTASSTAGVTYEVDISTSNTFASFLPGYNAVNVGSVLTINVNSGLTPNTAYYVRVRAVLGACYSLNTPVTTISTLPVPPVNDDCAAAVLVTVNPATTCTAVVSGTVVGATASAGPSSTCGTYDDDVWYKFVAGTNTHTITLQNLAGSTTDLTFQVLDACGASTALLCSDPQTGTVSGLTPGNTYYLRVASYSSTGGQTSTFDVCITTPANMSFVSSTTVQPSTATVGAGTINNQVLRVDVVVIGQNSPLTVTQLNLSTNGSTNAAGDISNAKVYYTGTSSTFASTTLFGTTASPNGAFVVTGSQALTGGTSNTTNYFWVVYDINCTATATNVVDAEAVSTTVGGTPQIPTVTAPAGTRAITAPLAGDNIGTAAAIVLGSAATNAFAVSGRSLEAGEPSPILNTQGGSQNGKSNYSWGSAAGGTYWYKLIVPTTGYGSSGNLLITTSALSTTDTQLALWEFPNIIAGSCALNWSGAKLIQANDDQIATMAIGAGGSLNSTLRCHLTPGNTYYLQIDGYTTSTPTGNVYVEDLADAAGYNVANNGMGRYFNPNGVNMHFAAYEVNGTDGWTYYYDNAGTSTTVVDDSILVAVKWANSPNFLYGGTYLPGTEMANHLRRDPRSTTAPAADGTFGAGTDSVIVWAGRNSASAASADLKPTAPYVNSSATHWWMMNKFWSLIPFKQPSVAIDVRTYYSDADFSALQTAVITGGGVLAAHTDMRFIKATKSASAHYSNAELDPSLGQATLAVGTVTDVTWVNTDNIEAGINQAQFSVSVFSGGGGGSTGVPALSPIPVTLMSFTAQRTGKVNVVNWSTSQELNSKHFILERSSDGRNFTAIATIAAAGYSAITRVYTYTDNNPVNGINYYRLNIVDKDNSSRYSWIRSVRNEGLADVSIYPNPVNDVLTVSISADKAGKGNMMITDVSGKVVYNKAISVAQGSNNLPVDLKNVSAGAYIIKVQLSDDVVVRKFNKM